MNTNQTKDLNSIIEEKIKKWDSIDPDYWNESRIKLFIRQSLTEIVEEYEKEIDKYKDALIWCSGSSDFQLEGQARKGWEKLCVPLLKDKANKFLNK